jgi:TetR/AcrR family transcriptional repressor of nem operon
MSLKKGDQTKERIIRAAVRLVHTRGYKNTSLDDIFAESDVNKGSFYFHFSSKDELVHAVIDRFFSAIERRFGLLAGNESALEKLTIYLDTLTALMKESGCTGGCLLGNLSLEVSDWHDDLRQHLAVCFERFKEIIAGIISEGQQKGEIRTDKSADELAVITLSLIEGGLILAKVGKAIDPLVSVKDNAIEYLRRVGN